MQDVMIDCETLGTRPGCVIRSIGAIFFDPHTSQLGYDFYVNVDRADCEGYGLTVDPSTETWWTRQSAAARAALDMSPASLKDALWQFSAWFQTNGGERIWSHGANFDQPIIEACYHAVGMQAPWSFWNSRCTRTLFDVAGIDARKMSAGEVKHNALDDARIQARASQACFAKLRGEAARLPPAPSPTVSKIEGVFA